jgi:hypothetical protein
MARKEKVNAAYGMIMGDPKKAKGNKTNPIGVLLTFDELARLEQIAAEVGVNRHVMMQYAIKDFIKRYDQGERPRTAKREITILAP